VRFIVRRLGFFLVTLWAAVTLNFLIPRLMPGNAVLAMMSRYKGHVNPQAMHALQIAFGIKAHESLLHAYFTYLGNIVHGDFGISLTFFPDTVSHQVLQALPWTLMLVGTTTILAFVLGTFIGLISAWRRGGSLDGLLPPIFVITSAFPYFWLALLAIWLFSIKLGWLPQSGATTSPTPSAGRGDSPATRPSTRSCRR
jgi:peptide/nickel transport system permease protein